MLAARHDDDDDETYVKMAANVAGDPKANF